MVQEQRTVVEEQPTTVTEPVTVAVDGGAAVAEAMAQAVADFDLSTPAGIKAAAEQYPALKNWREEGYGAGLEAGKQRTIQEQQRDQASAERVNATAKQILERYGIEMDDEDHKILTGLTRANADAARLEMMRTIALEAKGMAATESEAAMLQDLIDNASGDADAMQQVASRAVGTMSQKAQRDFKDSLSLDELMNDDKHKTAFDALVAQRVQAELEAQAIEGNHREQPPEAPMGAVGAVGAITPDRLASMSHDAKIELFSSMDDEQRGAMWATVLGTGGR